MKSRRALFEDTTNKLLRFAFMTWCVLLFGISACKTTQKAEKSKQATEQADERSDHEPRRHHYVFAHKALPMGFFSHPLQTVLILGTDRGTEFLSELWSKVGEKLEAGQRMQQAHFQIHRTRLDTTAGATYLAIVELPPPEYGTEAHMVGFVVQTQKGDLKRQVRQQKKPENIWYFTLEKAVGLPGGSEKHSTGTVLGGWDRDGKHLNYGAGPKPTVSAFREAVVQKTKKFEKAEAGQ